MVFLKCSAFFILLLLFSSCAKVSYLVEQGVGQLKLLNRAKENSVLLKDVRVSSKEKRKIKLVGLYKKYFYEYFSKKETNIYTKTTILEGEAVTYLVTASLYNKIGPYRVSFPFMGSFPYLGFFSKESALSYQKDLDQKDYITYLRPVYAYSTLGYFEDTILSSFFKYDDFFLAELVFHELFHTIFFIKDEVGLNENLANYFAVKMVREYFKKSSKELVKKRENDLKMKLIKKEIYLLVIRLNKLYEEKKPKSKLDSEIILKNFLTKEFFPRITQFCKEKNIDLKKCYPLHKKWNNARFVAFLTYEESGNDLERLQKKVGLDIKKFYYYIEERHKIYKNKGENKGFKKFLFKDL